MEPRSFIIYFLVTITISASQTTEGLNDFHPAEIYISSSSTIKEGESITIKCAMFHTSDLSDQFIMYLCRNGVGVMIGPVEKKGDYAFIIKNVSESDSGNYSCVYSLKKYTAKNVRASGQKSILVQVTVLERAPSEPPGEPQRMNFNVLISVGALLLVGTLALVICCTVRTCNKRNLNQGQSIDKEIAQDNTGQFKGFVPVHEEGIRVENNDEMYAYSTIPDIKVDKIASTLDADFAVYSLAQNNQVYSTVQKPEKGTTCSYMEAEQTTALYGKVQKKRKS